MTCCVQPERGQNDGENRSCGMDSIDECGQSMRQRYGKPCASHPTLNWRAFSPERLSAECPECPPADSEAEQSWSHYATVYGRWRDQSGVMQSPPRVKRRTSDPSARIV